MGHRGTPQECIIISKNSTTVTFCASKGAVKNLSLRVEDTSNFFHCLVVENGELEMTSCELSGGAWGVCVNNRASAILRGCQVCVGGRLGQGQSVCRRQVLILCQRLYYTCGFVCVCACVGVCVCEVDRRQGQRLQGVSSKACDSITCSAVVSRACALCQRGRHVT